MKKHVIVVLLTSVTVLFTNNVQAKIFDYLKPVKSLLNVSFSGYIKKDSFFDTRQTFPSGAADVVLFPRKKEFDPNCNDINAQGQFGMLDFETRIHTDIEGPKVLGAKASGVIETDFGGISDRFETFVFNHLRLRHAYGVLDWKHYSLLLGQYWHPMYVLECSADVIPADGGNPMALTSRNPQVRFTYHLPHVDLIAAVLAQVGFVNNGPIGFSASYTRDSMMPNFNASIQAHFDNHYVGGSIDLKRLVPRLVTDAGFKANESLLSVAGTVYGAFNWEHFTWKIKVNAGQNMTNFVTLGGYVVESIDQITDQRTYANLRVIGMWSEFIFKYGRAEPGIFFGYVKNFGAGKPVIPTIINENETTELLVFALGEDIDNVARVSPRLRVFYDPFVFASELEFTRAAFGTISNTASVVNTIPVTNVRLLIAMYYYF